MLTLGFFQVAATIHDLNQLLQALNNLLSDFRIERKNLNDLATSFAPSIFNRVLFLKIHPLSLIQKENLFNYPHCGSLTAQKKKGKLFSKEAPLSSCTGSHQKKNSKKDFYVF